jgi:hypothetical protein
MSRLHLSRGADRNGDYVEKWVHVQDSTDVSEIENKCLFYIFKHRRPYFWNYPRITPSLTRRWVCRLQLLLPSPAHSFSGPSPVWPTVIFYCPRFGTSLLAPPTTRRASVEVFNLLIPNNSRVALFAPVVSVIASRHGLTENPAFNNTSIVACVFVSSGTCLVNRCLETAVVYPPITRTLHSNGSTHHNVINNLYTFACLRLILCNSTEHGHLIIGYVIAHCTVLTFWKSIKTNSCMWIWGLL